MGAPLGNTNRLSHGFYSTRPILYETLDADERRVWDEAAVPGGADPVMEQLYRATQVMAYRIERHIKQAGGAEKLGKKVAGIRRIVDLSHRPIALSAKLLEVDARRHEVEAGADRRDLEEYLRRLPPEQLQELLVAEEMPLLDPGTGQAIPEGEFEVEDER